MSIRGEEEGLFKVKGGIENTKEVNCAGQDRRRSKRSRRRDDKNPPSSGINLIER